MRRLRPQSASHVPANKESSWLHIWTQPHRFVLLVAALCLFGLALIANVSGAESLQTFGHPWHFVEKQAMWLALGAGVYAVGYFLPSSWWKHTSPLFFGFTILLLIAVLIPGLGQRVQGAQRWLVLGSFRLQPSELTKLALVLFFSHWLTKHQRFLPFIVLVGTIFGLILLQPNLSTACIVTLLACILYFLAGGRVMPLLGLGVLGSILLGILIVSAPYRRERLMTFLNPASDPLGRSYHIRQITIALGRGGLWGQGIGLSRQKQQYVPEASTDSIFAIYAEETGFIGASLLVIGFLFFLRVCYGVAERQTDRYRFLVASGIASWLGLHVLLNIAAMVALVPLTGVPLPLISYGGSSTLSMLLALGILNRLAAEAHGEGQATHTRPVLRRRSVK